MKQENLLDLVNQASHMLLDRTKLEQDLIYFIAMMEDELRAAIIVAYQGLHNDST